MARRRLWWGLPLLLIVTGVCLYIAWPHWAVSPEEQVERLMGVLHLKRGMAAAEVGAGDGRMSVILAQRLGPEGTVVATEIESDKLEKIRRNAERAGVRNLAVVRAAEKSTNLEPECCDAIFLRRVYHHFTNPAEINEDLFAAVRPGGRLAVVDFGPLPWMFWLGRPDGVPANRGGHGARPDLVVQELTGAGFVLEQRLDQWPGRDYCLVFRKPPA
jgi:SAM-dependent methyltransferase